MKPLPRERIRQGALVVERAVVLPLLMVVMLGIWEVGRMIQVKQMLVNSAREGARLAAGGYTVNSAPVTQSMVTQACKDYLRGAGLPPAAYNGAQVTLTCMATPAWVNPHDAEPLDRFRLRVRIPPGAAYDSTRWAILPQLTNVNELDATVDWVSLNNEEITIDSNLPL